MTSLLRMESELGIELTLENWRALEIIEPRYTISPRMRIIIQVRSLAIRKAKNLRRKDFPMWRLRRSTICLGPPVLTSSADTADLVILVICRVCQQEEEEILIELGCQCRGGLAKAHESCINNWFRTRGSNKCEICQHVAANVSPPEPSPNTNYQVWRGDQVLRQPGFAPEHETGCFSPLWVAFSILIGGLLLDILISISLGVSALPVNIIIGVIVLLGLGTAFRLALEFCHQWSVRRLVQVEANVNQGYHPAL